MCSYLLSHPETLSPLFLIQFVLTIDFIWFLKHSTSTEAGPPLLCVRTRRSAFFSVSVRWGHLEVGSTLNALSRLVSFPLSALGCPALTRRWKGLCCTDSWECQSLSKWKETSAVRTSLALKEAPLTAGRFSSLHVMNLRRISGPSLREWGGGRLTAATKTVLLTLRGERSKREKEEQTSLPHTEQTQGALSLWRDD